MPRIKVSNGKIKAAVTNKPFVKVVEESEKATKPFIVREDVINNVVETLKENPVIVPPRIVDTPSEVNENTGSRRDPVAEVVSDSARVSVGDPPRRGKLKEPIDEVFEEDTVVSSDLIGGFRGPLVTEVRTTSNTPPPRSKESSGAEEPSPGRTAEQEQEQRVGREILI